MRFSTRYLLTLFFLSMLFWQHADTTLIAQDNALLEKRLAELEAENKALRKKINDIQKAAALKSSNSKPNTDGLRIIVLPDDWGEAGLLDMKKVADSAAHPIASLLENSSFSPIMIQRSKTGPITLYQRGVGNEYIVRLDTGDRAWAQMAFQFAHEFCHIICNYRDVDNSQLWFEETVCEVASLYSLRRMSENWETNPPYSNWKSYAAALSDYANDRISIQQEKKQSLAEFYREHEAALETSGTNRELNNFIAVKLLKHFEDTPAGWQAVRYLNLGEPNENKSFKTYLSGWYRRVPEKHRNFVTTIAREFELDLLKPSDSRLE